MDSMADLQVKQNLSSSSPCFKGEGMTSVRTRVRMVDRLRQKGIQDERVLEAILAVPRHIFVEEALASRAYEDTALPLGFAQTISQPYIVALMIEVLSAGRESLGKVLEIGGGCGYQAAVLGQLSGEVHSVERIAALYQIARSRIRQLKSFHVRVYHEDGHLGYASAAPFDSIILAAATAQIPEALAQQLAPGGRMIAPVVDEEDNRKQKLCIVDYTAQGLVTRYSVPVCFVPLCPGKI